MLKLTKKCTVDNNPKNSKQIKRCERTEIKNKYRRFGHLISY
ncbi:hypothetical protein OIU77_008117 [Salix suchowensis]|uniref:Uncharacterized protein n=1 Tax=Salix suchowensis TaxID=1278906 RepID=A0ABQ9AJT2_9ROSI|nr:hypothetical protein OIU77_008117 [Salix suchowensis]